MGHGTVRRQANRAGVLAREVRKTAQSAAEYLRSRVQQTPIGHGRDLLPTVVIKKVRKYLD